MHPEISRENNRTPRSGRTLWHLQVYSLVKRTRPEWLFSVLSLELFFITFQNSKNWDLQQLNPQNRRLRRKMGNFQKGPFFQKSLFFANLGEITTDGTRNKLSIACGLTRAGVSGANTGFSIFMWVGMRRMLRWSPDLDYIDSIRCLSMLIICIAISPLFRYEILENVYFLLVFGKIPF